MKTPLIALICLFIASVGWGKIKPESFKVEEGVGFEIVNLRDEIAEVRPDATDDIFLIDFEGIEARIPVPEGISLDWLKQQRRLKIECRITPAMDYNSLTKTWEETTDILISKVSAGKKTIFDASRCELHDVPMSRELMPVIYGSGGENWELMISQDHPHSGHFALEGCVAPQERYTHAYRYVCPICKKLYEQKNAAQKVSQQSGITSSQPTIKQSAK